MDRNKLGISLFLGSEAIFFILLILAYINFHSLTAQQAARYLDPAKTAIFTLLLLSSSLTLWLAERNQRGGNFQRVNTWLAATIGLGGIFLLGQGSEYLHLFNLNVTVAQNMFGTTFFTLTGFHGIHVLIGLIALSILLALAMAGQLKKPGSSAIEAVALYWHFVDGVWIVIFSVVYLWTLL